MLFLLSKQIQLIHITHCNYRLDIMHYYPMLNYNENNILLEKMRFNLEYENNNLKELVNNIINIINISIL